MAAATVRALDRWPSGRALIVSDDQPVRWSDLFSSWRPPPARRRPAGRRIGLPSFRVRNACARDALVRAPFHPSYSGLIR
jgi:hypothetical protein